MLTNKEAAREARRIRAYRAWVEAQREEDSRDDLASAAADAAALRHMHPRIVAAVQRYAAVLTPPE